MSDLEARIAEAVTKHRAGATNAVQTCCMCDSTWRTHADHDTHAAAPLSGIIREAQVEALREAADGFRHCADWGFRATRPMATEDYLRTRADNLEKP